MKKLILFLLLIIPLNIKAIELNSQSVIIVNRENNEILYEKNIEEQLPIASLTKIMTTIIALENIKDLNEKITITYDDINITNDYVTLGLKEHEEISYKDLLFGTIINSGADSALSLANHTFNNYEEFINKMNYKAKELGMNNTNFSNPIGYDENNYSTAKDLYNLLDYALKNENFYEIYTTQEYKINHLNKKINNYVNKIIEKQEIENKNNIRFLGTKTGFTTLSGMSLSGISNIENNEILIITLKAIGKQEERLHIKDSINLLNYINDTYDNKIIVNKNELVDNIIYKKGKKNLKYEIKLNNDIKHYINKEVDLRYLKIIYDGNITLDNKIKQGERIGNINIYYKDRLIEKETVFFNKNNIILEKKDYKKIFLIILLILVLSIYLIKINKRD